MTAYMYVFLDTAVLAKDAPLTYTVLKTGDIQGGHGMDDKKWWFLFVQTVELRENL